VCVRAALACWIMTLVEYEVKKGGYQRKRHEMAWCRKHVVVRVGIGRLFADVLRERQDVVKWR